TINKPITCYDIDKFRAFKHFVYIRTIMVYNNIID
ncbi:hypothetical protein ACUXHK_002579, partial [Staphylococcus cohnii]